MQTERIEPGRPLPARLVGAILSRDIVVGDERWQKGRRLSEADIARLSDPRATAPSVRGALGTKAESAALTVLVPGPDDVHEDDAAARLARAIAGGNLSLRGPVQSRVDLVSDVAGVARINVAALERLNRLDPLEAFTVFDGQPVEAGDLVASVKIAPHLVRGAVLARAEGLVGRFGPIVAVSPFTPHRVAAVAKDTVPAAARVRFERSVRAKVEGLGSVLVAIRYAEDSADAFAGALAGFVRGPGRADLVLTAGAASTDPLDSVFVALERLGGRVVRHGVPAHPGSMLWLGRVGRVAVLGLPTCGAYSKATAADLLLPRLLAGEPATAATVARLGHGGVLSREMRFRFPAYAQELEAPSG